MMMMNFNLMIFFSLMILSMFMGLNANSVMFFWMSIEINMMSFLPMILFMNKFFNDGAMKYFLIQSLSSSLLLYFAMMMYLNIFMDWIYLMIFISIIMKMGGFPFYYWYINLMSSLSWMNCFILMTIQKLLPFYFLNTFLSIYKSFNLLSNLVMNFMLIIILMSSVTSVCLIYSINSIKLLMSMSSLNHLSWMLIMLMTNMKMWMVYFFTYSLILLMLILLMKFYKILYINQLFSLNSFLNKMYMYMYMFMLMSLPPLMGFFLKNISIFMMFKFNMGLITYSLLLISMIMFFYYMKLFSPSMMFYNKNLSMNNLIYLKYNKNILQLNIIILLTMMSLIYYMYM